MKYLLGVRAMNEFWQQAALALYEARALGEYRTGWNVPAWLGESLSSRWIATVPPRFVSGRSAWDLARIAASRLGLPPRIEDWVFDAGERRFDEDCARSMQASAFDGFIGAEYGSLAALRAAGENGKRGVVTYVSVHHRFRERWVDSLFEQNPQVLSPDRRSLQALAKERDGRRDAEAAAAEKVLSCSPLVTQSLIESGISPEKIWTVLLGAPAALPESDLTLPSKNDKRRFIFAGQVAAHKGVHVLFEAWRRLRPDAELHLYGTVQLPAQIFADLPSSVVLHGAVSRAELFAAFRHAHALVFPSLADGFGAVVTEALSRGLPVIASQNAGASALIEDGRAGLTIPAGDSEALAQAIAQSLDRPAEWEGKRLAALLVAAENGWPQFRRRLRAALAPEARTPNSSKTICIVTPDTLSSTPRVVKEADALCEAGFRVRVVGSHGTVEHTRAFDLELMRTKTWEFAKIGWSPAHPSERSTFLWSALRRRIFLRMPRMFHRFTWVAERAEGRLDPELSALAAAKAADCFIGHYPAGLAAAAHAAAQQGAILRYDAEDFHTGEFNGTPDARGHRVARIESAYLPRCSGITAASPFIAEKLSEKFGVARPQTVLNAFPLYGERTVEEENAGQRLRLYWFSQSLGADRGLETAIASLAKLEDRAELHLQGFATVDERRRLERLAEEHGVRSNLFFHQSISPESLPQSARRFDVGLALESPVSLNRRLAISNKILFYLACGLAIAATDLPGQRYVMSLAPGAGFLFPTEDAAALAGGLLVWVRDRRQLVLNKRAAYEAARDRLNWSIEQRALVSEIQSNWA